MTAHRGAARISVIIPTHRDRGFLPEALASAVRSIEPGDEILVVANGSPAEYLDTLRTLVRAPARLLEIAEAGVCRARNEGARSATGDFLLFLDDDDILGDGAVSHLRQLLAANPSWSAVAGNLERFGDVEGRWERFTAPADAVRPHELLGQCFVSPGIALLRRGAFEVAGGFDAAFTPTDDYEFWMKVVLAGPIVGTNVLALRYRTHPANVSNQAVRMADRALATFRRHAASVEAVDGTAACARAARFNVRWYVPRLRRVVRNALSDGDLPGAARALRLMAAWHIQHRTLWVRARLMPRGSRRPSAGVVAN